MDKSLNKCEKQPSIEVKPRFRSQHSLFHIIHFSKCFNKFPMEKGNTVVIQFLMLQCLCYNQAVLLSGTVLYFSHWE